MKIAISFLLMISLAGCSGDREEREIKIALSFAGDHPLTMSHYYQGIEDSQQHLKVSVAVRSAFMNHEMQSGQIDTLLMDNPDVIVLEAVDPHRGGELVARISSAGIPVIGYNKLTGAHYDLVITPDYKSIGRQIAEEMVHRPGSRIHEVFVVRDELFGPQDSMFTYAFAATLETYDVVAVRHIAISDLYQSIPHADAVVCTNVESLRLIVSDYASISDTPLLIGPAPGEIFDEPVSADLLLIDIRPYDAGVRIVEAAAGYAQGAFRHRHTEVMRVGDALYPVVYTPHRITIYND